MKILISSCLLGEDVRYDGNNSSIAFTPSFTFSIKELFMDILCENEIYSFCPEVAGGLSVPRASSEIIKNDKPFIVKNEKGDDVTINFLLGAKKALDICKEENIKVALLKAKSPSCGNKQIYDGTFSSKLIDGQGLTARLLEENGVKVFNENEIKDLAKFIKTNK
ncbi:DUF523 domain-containing protein [Arcobacter cloacae]|uniref:Uncharacterized protein n=1 Tax=Arcobacter cloacae TaxID=1054034 RepID=A0A4Q0ZMD9_9BACT|nr:DUF523 domain-containing protein [Arcobacter cloacae]RXJ84738.1 hypothetical protein CRU90_05110 [Arcobacter cloacae]